MNKAYVLVMVMIVVNLVFVWFDAMEFFAYQPMGTNVEYPRNYAIDFFVAAGMISLAAVASVFIKVNAFAMIMFTTIFWYPFYLTSGIFLEILKDAPMAFLGIIGIFTTIMLFIYAYALIEMSSSTVVSG